MKLYQDGKRNIALDGLKVLAAFLVVMLHCTAFSMTEAGPTALPLRPRLF